MIEDRTIILVPDDLEEDEKWDGDPDNAKIKEIPRETFDQITNFLANPETGVRLERPKRKDS